jgi:hypothetical protein
MDEPGTTAPAMTGRAQRVLGTFLLILGAGMVLESTGPRLGTLVMVVGAVALVRGLLDARPHGAAHAHPPVAIDAGSESRS